MELNREPVNLSAGEKRKYLFLKQIATLDLFREKNAISKEQYDISYHGLIYKDKKVFAKFSVDRMCELEITDEQGTDLPTNLDMSCFFEKEFSMMNGETCQVELLCENKLMSSIVDKFGDDVKTEIMNEERFKAVVDVNLSGNFYGWVFASKWKMQILTPDRARDEFQGIVDRCLLYMSQNMRTCGFGK